MKREDCFAASVPCVWEIDPKSRTMRVFDGPDAACAVLAEGDVLCGERQLAGFELSLSDFFAELDRCG